MNERVSSLKPILCLLVHIGLIAVPLVGSGCDKPHEQPAAAPPPPEVVVSLPVQREVTDYVMYTGTTEAFMTVELRARVQGFLEEVKFRPGQVVKKGDLLFVIDKRQFQASVASARATIQTLQAALQSAENEARLARELADQSAGPEIDAIIKLAKRDEVKGQIEAANAQLEQAQLNLEYCEVRAPIEGRITKNLVDEGNLVGRSDPTLLATIVATKPLYVSLEVSDKDVQMFRKRAMERGREHEPGNDDSGKPMKVELGLANQEDYPVSGVLDYVAPEVNRDTGTLNVRARFENADEGLLPGYFAKVRTPLQTYPALLVPDAALLSDQTGRFAYIVGGDGKVELRRVKVGGLEGQFRVIEQGLEADDRVIVAGLLRARPGATVTARLQEEPAAKKPPRTPSPSKSGGPTH